MCLDFSKVAKEAVRQSTRGLIEDLLQLAGVLGFGFLQIPSWIQEYDSVLIVRTHAPLCKQTGGEEEEEGLD